MSSICFTSRGQRWGTCRRWCSAQISSFSISERPKVASLMSLRMENVRTRFQGQTVVALAALVTVLDGVSAFLLYLVG